MFGVGARRHDPAVVTMPHPPGRPSPRRRQRRLTAVCLAIGVATPTLIGCSEPDSTPSGSERASTATEGSASTRARVADFSAVTARLEGAIASNELPGVGLVIVDRDEVLYEEAFGTSAVSSELLLASATKLASASTIMTLVDDGLVDLDDPIDAYLPAFADTRGDITIRQLLAQTHGLPFNHPSIPLPGRTSDLTLEQAVDQIARDVVPVRPPGTASDYSPEIAYQILGRIAEVATGEPWSALFETRIADPLDMSQTTYNDDQNPRLGGGASSTLADYAHLLQMHLAGGTFRGERVLSEAAVLEMQQDHVDDLPFLSDPDKAEVGYGLAWWFDEVEPGGAPTQISVPGLFGSIPWIDLSRGYGAFLLTFDRLSNSVLVWEEVVPLIRAALDAGDA